MAELKGFYFSLDALTSATIMIATIGLLIAYNPSADTSSESKGSSLYSSIAQYYNEWNQSISYSERKVLTEIYYRYYRGNKSHAGDLCQKYFDKDKFALYFENSSKTDKACGTIDINTGQSLSTFQSPTIDIKVNKSFLGPKTAVMVIKN